MERKPYHSDEIKTYYPGNVIRTEIGVLNHASVPPNSVTAIFLHAQDQDARIELNGQYSGGGGRRRGRGGREVAGDMSVRLTAKVTDQDKPGLYRLRFVSMNYEGIANVHAEPTYACFRVGEKVDP